MKELEGLKTSPGLLALLEKARDHVMTAEELFEQRVSFVYGCLGLDDPRTKEQVREAVRALDWSKIPAQGGGEGRIRTDGTV